MPQDDTGQRPRTRAELEAQLRALEERRDSLEALIAASRSPDDRSKEAVRTADPASIRRTLEGTLNAIEPVLSKMTSAREMLRADGAASAAGDAAGEADASRLLDGLSGILDELTVSITQLHAAADRMRASVASSSAGQERQ